MDIEPVHVLYAYALTWNRDLELPVLDGVVRPRLLEDDALGLVVSDICLDELRADTVDTPANSTIAKLARRHDRVVQAVFDQTTVLPMRFCTLFADVEEAGRLLEAYRGRARQRLDELENRREWGVKLMPGQGSSADPIEPRAARRLTEAAETRLAAHVTEAVRRRVFETGEPSLSNVAFLVHRMAEDAFLADVQRLRRSLAVHGIDVRLTGPWPPYSFAQIDWAVSERA